MAIEYKTIVVYCVIAVAIAAGVAYLLSTQLNHSYSIRVALETNASPAMYPFQTAGFRASVNNTGSSTASRFPLLIYLNGNPTGSYNVTLPPGKGAPLFWNYTFPYNGTYAFQVIADPGHVLQITNRSAAQASVTVNVSPPQSPRAYSSIPNNGIASTQAFTLLRNGSAALSNIALGYNLSLVNNMLGPARSIVLRTLSDLSGTINLGEGAIAYYPGNTIAYTIWLQGTLSPKPVGVIINSFSIPQSGINANGSAATFARVSNTVSTCFYYSQGWTKIVSYYNGTANATCEGIVSTAYNDTESSFLLASSNSVSRLKNLSSTFYYTNSTYLGSALTYIGGSPGAASLFSNQYGTFLSRISRNAQSVNLTTNQTCNGIVYPSANVFICSSFLSPIANSHETTGLINETEVTANYTASIYSFVNQSNLAIANQNGLALILALNLSNRSIGWNTPFKNTCTLNSPALSCNVVSFSHTNQTTRLGVGNSFSSAIRLTRITCAYPGARFNQTLNQSIVPGHTANVTTICHNIPYIPVTTVTTSYSLTLNYTILGVPKSATGYVNISNLAV